MHTIVFGLPFAVALLIALIAFLLETGAKAEPAAPAEPAVISVLNPIVFSGDTFAVDGVTYRLWGIEAPARLQECQDARGRYRCGQQATLMLRTLFLAKPVQCVRVQKPRGRPILSTGSAISPHPVRCGFAFPAPWASDSDFAEIMVRSGYAFADRSESATYLAAERTAEEAEAGLWRGRFVLPWEWRE